MSNTNFLAALQAKRTVPQAIEQRVSDLAKKAAESATYKITPSPITPISDLIPNQVCTKPEVIADVQTFATPISATKPTLIVERVLNRNRIDLFFSSKPDDDILGSLNGNGWHFRSKDKAWYHQDNDCNRYYLYHKFGVKIDDSVPEPQTEIIEQCEPETLESQEFTEFKRKVNLLVSHFKISPADLMLLAIDALFEKHESEIN